MKIVAVTACPSGIVQTYMAAEMIEKVATKKGHQVHVETQGALGIENAITTKQIKEADVVLLTKEMPIQQMQRFEGKKIVYITVKDAIMKIQAILDELEHR